MQVLFLALGANRRRAAIEESAQVVADGGHAVVLIDDAKPWRRVSFDPGAQVVELSRLECAHLPMKVERLLLFKVPGLLFRTVGRGALRKWARRAADAYERRLADRVHRRLVVPLYRSVWGEASRSLIQRHVLDGASFDLFVVTDLASMPCAARLLASYDASDAEAPQLAFGLDYALPAVPAERTR